MAERMQQNAKSERKARRRSVNALCSIFCSQFLLFSYIDSYRGNGEVQAEIFAFGEASLALLGMALTTRRRCLPIEPLPNIDDVCSIEEAEYEAPQRVVTPIAPEDDPRTLYPNVSDMNFTLPGGSLKQKRDRRTGIAVYEMDGETFFAPENPGSV